MRKAETPEERQKRRAHNNNQAVYASKKKKLAKNMKSFIKTEGLWEAFQEWNAQ